MSLNPNDLPGVQSLDTISKALLLLTMLIEVGCLSQPFVWLVAPDVAGYMWVSMNIIALATGIAGLVTRTSCRPPAAHADRPGSMWGREVGPLFWISVVLSGFSLLMLIAFILALTISPNWTWDHHLEWYTRFFYVIAVAFMVAPPLTVFSLASSFFYRRAQELRADMIGVPAYSRDGFSQIEMVEA